MEPLSLNRKAPKLSRVHTSRLQAIEVVPRMRSSFSANQVTSLSRASVKHGFNICSLYLSMFRLRTLICLLHQTKDPKPYTLNRN